MGMFSTMADWGGSQGLRCYEAQNIWRKPKSQKRGLCLFHGFKARHGSVSGMKQPNQIFDLTDIFTRKMIAFLLHNVISYQKIQ